MISQIARQICDQTDKLSRLRQTVSQAESVSATERLLNEIAAELRGWVGVFSSIEQLIDPEKAMAIRAEIAPIGRQLATSRRDFANQNLQQAVRLTQVKGKVERLNAITAEAWSEYGRARVAPFQDLVSVAERLPHMVQQMGAIRASVASAQRLASTLPSSPEKVEEFHTHLETLHTYLSDLEGLPEDVSAFLRKLTRGNATMADVTQTVFEWCRAEGIAPRLRIVNP